MRILILLLMILMSIRCTTSPETNATAGASWYSTMHRLSSNHSALTPAISDPKQFYDPKNLTFLREKTNDMLKASTEMTKDATAPNADPIIMFTAQQFTQDLQSASELLDTGKLQPAHYTLSQLSNYCISCHTRADRGSKNFPIPWATNLSHLTSSQKILFYLANRQYETAHHETNKIIQNEALLVQDPNTWMQLVQKDMAVIVRVQKDLPRAQNLVEQVLKTKNLPEYMKYDVKSWSQSLNDWKNEEKRTIEGTKNLAFVKKLLDKARQPKYLQGQAGFVIYLRASGILHELLESSRNSSNYSSILYFAGVTAEALKNVDVWKLGEHYFEVCIENAPNTVVAQKCYQQLEHLMLASHPNLNLLPALAKRINERLAKYKDLSRVQLQPIEKLRPNESGPRF
ncbi:hypothetical protein K2X05_08430 [bacterium]|nr:hypothetical protein [bacterium]